MKHKLLFLLFGIFISQLNYSQIANTPPNMEVCEDNGFATFYLTNSDSTILGAQNPVDFTITYHETLIDAQTNTNSISSPYQNITSPQTIYVRLEEIATGMFDTTTFDLVVYLEDDSSFSVTPNCDGGTITIDGSAGGVFAFNPVPTDQAVINPATGEVTNATSGASYNIEYTTNGFCPNSSLEILNVLPVDDASFTLTATCDGATATITGLAGGTFTFNPIPTDGAVIDPTTGTVTLGTPETTYTIEYTTTGYCPSTFTQDVTTIDCTDSDSDGVIDSDEDINENNDLTDDDTDNDGIPNYLDDDDDGDTIDTAIELTFNPTGRFSNTTSQLFIDTDEDLIENYLDDDDDGDGILTINEDYNNNGDPTDDDTDTSGIPDYLESSVVLGIDEFTNSSFEIFPNPVKNFLNINFNTILKGTLVVAIYDIQGKLVLKENNLEEVSMQLDVSILKSGFYFVKMKTDQQEITKKIIID